MTVIIAEVNPIIVEKETIINVKTLSLLVNGDSLDFR